VKDLEMPKARFIGLDEASQLYDGIESLGAGPKASFQRSSANLIRGDLLPSTDRGHLEKLFKEPTVEVPGPHAYKIRDALVTIEGLIVLPTNHVILESV
jgi:hypothetical protein